MTRRISFTLLLSFAVVAPAWGTPSLFFDFGDLNQQTAGNYNNVTHLQEPVVNAVDSDGNATGISLTVTDLFWPGSNTGGTTTPSGDATMFDAQATRDNLFGNTSEFGSNTEPTGGFTLSGLNTAPGVTYNFTFFAARMGVSDNRETAFSVTGGNVGINFLNPSNNVSEVATISSIVADGTGEIVVSVAPGPNNDSSFGFYYLGSMRMDIVPEPATALLLGFGTLSVLRRRRAQ